MRKPKAYAHLTDYQFAVQQVLNSVSVIIRKDGKQLKGDNCPISIARIIAFNNMYNIANVLDPKTSYIINLK